MKPTIKWALICATLFIVAKMLFLQFGVFKKDVVIPGAINIFFMLMAICIGLYYQKIKEGFNEGTALSDIKNALTAAVPYLIITSSFLGLFYSKIDDTFPKSRTEIMMNAIRKSTEDPASLAKMKEQNIAWKTASVEQIIRESQKNISVQNSPKSVFVFSLLGMLVMGTFFSVFVTVIYRRILSKVVS